MQRETQNILGRIVETIVGAVIGGIEGTQVVDVEIEIVEIIKIVEIDETIITEVDPTHAIIIRDVDPEVEVIQDNANVIDHPRHQVILDHAHHHW